MSICEFFAKLDSVYEDRDSLYLVLNFAKHGSISQYFKKSKSLISEEEMRLVT